MLHFMSLILCANDFPKKKNRHVIGTQKILMVMCYQSEVFTNWMQHKFDT